MIILQDLASCFPAEILLQARHVVPGPLYALDATSAPGNKTTHLSALLAGHDTGAHVSAQAWLVFGVAY